MSDPQPTTASYASASGAPLLQVEHVSKQFGGVRALDDVKFDVMTGEVLCLAGENGCGKSTLIKIITGVYQPEPGAEMRFQGRPIEGLSPAIARDLGIQVIWQDLALFAELSVLENIGFERNLGARPRLVDYRSMRADSERILERLGVGLDLDAPLRSLPIAQRQIVAVARALVTKAGSSSWTSRPPRSAMPRPKRFSRSCAGFRPKASQSCSSATASRRCSKCAAG
jgi:simple sugar transport system ATP-binding protein